MITNRKIGTSYARHHPTNYTNCPISPLMHATSTNSQNKHYFVKSQNDQGLKFSITFINFLHIINPPSLTEKISVVNIDLRMTTLRCLHP